MSQHGWAATIARGMYPGYDWAFDVKDLGDTIKMRGTSGTHTTPTIDVRRHGRDIPKRQFARHLVEQLGVPVTFAETNT